jgi:hypothetical protein
MALPLSRMLRPYAAIDIEFDYEGFEKEENLASSLKLGLPISRMVLHHDLYNEQEPFLW